MGNNIQLAMRLNIQNPIPIGNTLFWQGEANTIEQSLSRTALVFGNHQQTIKRIAWCTGGAQTYIKHAIDVSANCFISGEVSEQTSAIAQENNIAFISAGHHASEHYGVQPLCQHLSQQFTLKHRFTDIENEA